MTKPDWDHEVLRLAERWRFGPVTVAMRILTHSGMAWAWLLATALIGAAQYGHVTLVVDQSLFFRSMAAAGLAWIVGAIVKRVVRRPRPSVRWPKLRPLARLPDPYSFPSSHAGTAFAFFWALHRNGHPWAPAVGVWAAGVALSRMYLGVHYPSDILGGLAMGFACAELWQLAP